MRCPQLAIWNSCDIFANLGWSRPIFVASNGTAMSLGWLLGIATSSYPQMVLFPVSEWLIILWPWFTPYIYISKIIWLYTIFWLYQPLFTVTNGPFFSSLVTACLGRTPPGTEASQVSGLGQVQEWLKPATLAARKVILVRFESSNLILVSINQSLILIDTLWKW